MTEVGESGPAGRLKFRLSKLRPSARKEARAIEGLRSFVEKDFLPREKSILAVGEKDDDATRTFQSYGLPDQIQRLDKNEQPIHRCLLDREEYAVRVQGLDGYQKLGELVEKDSTRISSAVRQAAKAEPKPDSPVARGFTNLEVVVGDPRLPDHCYRYRLRRIHLEPKEEKAYLIVFPNLELDKLANYYTSRKRSKGFGETAPAVTIINLDRLTPAPPISHQRLPRQEGTVNEELWVEVDVNKPSWIVTPSAKAMLDKMVSLRQRNIRDQKKPDKS